MSIPITAEQAADLFDVPTELLYVCDGRRKCGKGQCLDHSNPDFCHHTTDASHALYAEHLSLQRWYQYPATRGGEAATLLVEPYRDE